MAERTVKLVFLGGPSDSYARNLLINELVFAVVLVIGLVLQFYFRIEWGTSEELRAKREAYHKKMVELVKDEAHREFARKALLTK